MKSMAYSCGMIHIVLNTYFAIIVVHNCGQAFYSTFLWTLESVSFSPIAIHGIQKTLCTSQRLW